MLNVGAKELLDESGLAAGTISAVLERAGGRIIGQFRVTAPFRQSGLADDLLNSLVSGSPLVRAAGARLCGALRLPESVMWIADLLDDPDSSVRNAAIRALGSLGGWRAIGALTAAGDRISTLRLAITMARGASDLDIEAVLREATTAKVAVATVLACGLRKDSQRIPSLLGVVNDRRWPKPVRTAACIALGMIGDPLTLDDLAHVADTDPVPVVKTAAARARRRILRVGERQK